MRPVATERARTKRTALRDVCCGLGPEDTPYPERHAGWSVALVRRGTFAYRAHDARRPVELREGWILLGRDDAEFQCAHPARGGDECAALHVDASLLDEVRSAVRLGGRDPFPVSTLPTVPRVSGEMAAFDRALRDGEAPDVDALAASVLEAVLEACGAQRAPAREPSARDRDRVRAALDAMDRQPGEPWPLGDLAALVGSSPFHFSRVFHAIVGTTPHRYLVAARVRRAAELLLETERRITDIAFDVGFGDLSNFVHTFRREMGAAPRDFRARARR